MDSVNFWIQLVLKATSHLNGKLLGCQESWKVQTTDLGLPCWTLLPDRFWAYFFIVWRGHNQIGSWRNRYVQSRRVIFCDNAETMAQLWELRRTRTIKAISRFCGFTGTRRSLKWVHRTYFLCLRARTGKRRRSWLRTWRTWFCRAWLVTRLS